jgi:hypothetical protein
MDPESLPFAWIFNPLNCTKPSPSHKQIRLQEYIKKLRGDLQCRAISSAKKSRAIQRINLSCSWLLMEIVLKTR